MNFHYSRPAPPAPAPAPGSDAQLEPWALWLIARGRVSDSASDSERMDLLFESQQLFPGTGPKGDTTDAEDAKREAASDLHRLQAASH
jgi:hypothetical protein